MEIEYEYEESQQKEYIFMNQDQTLCKFIQDKNSNICPFSQFIHQTQNQQKQNSQQDHNNSINSFNGFQQNNVQYFDFFDNYMISVLLKYFTFYEVQQLKRLNKQFYHVIQIISNEPKKLKFKQIFEGKITKNKKQITKGKPHNENLNEQIFLNMQRKRQIESDLDTTSQNFLNINQIRSQQQTQQQNINQQINDIFSNINLLPFSQ